MPATPPPAGGPLLALHITLNVLGYAAFALSFVLSLIYLMQNQLAAAPPPGEHGLAVSGAGECWSA